MSDIEYRETLNELAKYVDLDPPRNSPEGKKMDQLINKLIQYEEEHFPGWN